jgi:hypothetical protein
MNVSGQTPRADLTKILSVIGEIKKGEEKGKKGVPDSLDFVFVNSKSMQTSARSDRQNATSRANLRDGSTFFVLRHGASLSAKSVQSTDFLDS